MSSTTFADLGVSESVRAVLDERGITTPFPVQQLVLPVASTGRDVLVSSPTGSGKTLAFGLPMIERLERGGRLPSALILAPTRELASQIEAELTPLAAARGLRMAVCYGGVGLEAQARKASRADIIVATPGRLIDLARQKRVDLRGVRILVLDEADRMLDMGFLPQVKSIVEQLPRERHTMFFSATLDGQIGTLAERFTRDAERLHTVASPNDTGETLSERLSQNFLACTPATRTEDLLTLIRSEDDLVLVFCRTRRGAGRLAERLERQGLTATSMHGDLSQSQRERALRRFAGGHARVLVATDVAARGIDLDDIGLVINFDPPEDHDAYTHRVGRTARAGRTGRAVTMVMPEHAEQLGRMATKLGLEEPWSETGYELAPARVVYGSRRRGSGSPQSRPARARPSVGAPVPARANRVQRGARTPSS
jgi:superfamily II DNA/RNA helicase